MWAFCFSLFGFLLRVKVRHADRLRASFSVLPSSCLQFFLLLPSLTFSSLLLTSHFIYNIYHYKVEAY